MADERPSTHLPIAQRSAPYEDESVRRFLGAPPDEQARTLTTLGLPPAVALLLVNACENRCFFCASPGTTSVPPGAVTRLEAAKAHLSARPEGVTTLLVGGNEPTVHPDFDAIIAHAHAAGFTHVELMTSGLGLGETSRLARWRHLGLESVAVPIYASHGALHDEVTGTSSFDRLVLGLDAAHTAGIVLHLHTLLLRRTATELPALARMVWSRWGVPLAVAPLREKPSLFRLADEALPLDEVAPLLASIEVPIARLGLSTCFARERPMATSLVMEMYFRSQRRRFVDGCSTCLDRTACPGIVDGQLEAFGDGALTPRR
jgi:molybdenum cofactor biosynthesis enzyme MoaA